MMDGHPFGLTKELTDMAELSPPCRLLDMGAGEGKTVAALRSRGFDAEGVDIVPRGDFVRRGDMLFLPFSDGLFDVVISECAFEVSGDRRKAFCEAYRVLKKGGLLLISDVFRDSPIPPAENAGFSVLTFKDRTEAFISYVMELIWSGAEAPSSEKGCGYYIMICRKD